MTPIVADPYEIALRKSTSIDGRDPFSFGEDVNEELETLNEELQSTVEELNTTNDELEARTSSLERSSEELKNNVGELETARRALVEALRTSGGCAAVIDDSGKPLYLSERLGSPSELRRLGAWWLSDGILQINGNEVPYVVKQAGKNDELTIVLLR